jgi:predicted ATP-binding protein involved in virulence
MEHHPRLNQSDLIIRKPKIILGSFPPWSLTEPDFEKFETLTQKEFERINNRDFPFFYGSYVNRFWNWYQKFIDEAISKEDIDSIQKSLKEKSIGITDVIISCTRKDRSALDKHLTNRTYNHQFFKYPKKGETIKILCTSKGVMNEMLLN